MRRAFDAVAIAGTVVIGEGEMDEAPMLYIGEKVGLGGPEMDIAVDPLEGTNICATGGPNSIATLAVAPLALGDEGWYSRLLASRPMVWLGEISYEIFLIHLVTMELVMVEILQYPIYNGSVWLLFLGTMVVTMPLAWLLHRFTRVR